uniref:Uncharacterized protein n=1 Tax=Rhizophora mucronata TaxID=61149 RepID=A0A2P2J618_RHIMU
MTNDNLARTSGRGSDSRRSSISSNAISVLTYRADSAEIASPGCLPLMTSSTNTP